MASFKKNIHHNIQVGIDARVDAMNEYHHSKQKLRSNLLEPSVTSEDYTLSREAQVAKSTYVRMISPGTTTTHVIYGGYNIDDTSVTGQSTGSTDYFKSQASRITGPETAYYETATDHASLKGQRPKPGITNVNVLFQGYGGATRKATITWACSSLEQLEMYQKGSFLSPGQTIILDWGWVRSDSSFRSREMPKFLIEEGDGKVTLNKDLFTVRIEEIDGKPFKKYTPVWDKLEVSQYGDWSGIIGPVTKFTWSQRDDGGFDCITEMLAKGSNIFQKQMPQVSADKGATLSTFPGKRLTHDQFVTAVVKKSMDSSAPSPYATLTKPVFNIAERIDSLDYEILIKYFPGALKEGESMSAKLSTEGDYEIINSKDKNIFGILRPKGSEGEDSPNLYEEEENDEGKKIFNKTRDFSNEMWVRWGWFEDNIVSYYSRENTADGELRLNEFRSLMPIYDYDGKKINLTSIEIKNHKELVTYDPSIFIIPDKYPKHWFYPDDPNKKVDKSYYELAEKLPEIAYSFGNSGDDRDSTPPGKGKLRNLYINLSVIKKSFLSPGASIQSGMIAMANSLNSGINLWNFEVDSAAALTSAQRTFFISEKGDDEPSKNEGLCELCNKEESQLPAKSYIFDNYGENSIIHDISLTAVVPDKFAIVAGYGMESGKGNQKDDAMKTFFADTADSRDEVLAAAVGAFYTNPDNANYFQPLVRTNPDLQFGNILEPYNGVPELTATGLSYSSLDNWNHTIVTELLDTTPSTRISSTEIFNKKYKAAMDKQTADAEAARNAGEDFQVEHLFPHGASSKAERAPYSLSDGKLKKEFVSNINWLLVECPATRLTSHSSVITMPINIDMTLEGLGGIYPGNMFRLSYLPESYGQVNFKDGEPEASPKTYFQIMGVTHTINQEGWQTKITAITNKATMETAGIEKDMKDTREKIEKAYNEYMQEWTTTGDINDVPEVIDSMDRGGRLKGKEAYLPGPWDNDEGLEGEPEDFE